MFSYFCATPDLWHLVTGFDTDAAGESGLQSFYLAQLGAPLALVLMAAVSLNTLFLNRHDNDRRMDAITRGWRMGKASKPLFGVDWEMLFATPVDEVRRSLGLNTDDGQQETRPEAARRAA